MNIKTSIERSLVSLSLNSYDDIFSDFDPRHYSQRSLSDDFLSEAKKAAFEKGDAIELRFLVPAGIRNMSSETIIRKRLKDHFSKHAGILEHKKHKGVVVGMLTACLGFTLIMCATFFTEEETFLERLALVILEPSGWFTMWTGFDHVVDALKLNAPDLNFYRKMADATITFEIH